MTNKAFSGTGHSEFEVGHRSAAETVSHLIELFPLQGTDEAVEMALRDRATKAAIVDKLQEIKAWDVDVRSCFGSIRSSCIIGRESDIAYIVQEKLLQGLVNLAHDLENGEESRPSVSISDLSWLRYWWRRSELFTQMPLEQSRLRRYRSWNSWLRGDEGETEELILEYMERLRGEGQL